MPKGRSITYTNRAKEELNSRINSKNVTVDTIHSFLSDFVGLYFSKPEVIDLYLQVFEKKIKALIDNGEDDSKNARYIDKFGKLDFETIKNNLHKVFYNEQSYSSYYYGGLSHDDMLLFCRKMFEKFEMLKKRLSNKYRYIFIDEYQDTSADVLYIFYQSVLNTSSTLYEIMNSKADQISFDVLKKAFAATCMKRETSFGEEEVRETLDKIKDDSGLEEMWNRFKRVNYFVDDLSWGEVSETIVDNIEKIFFLATRFLESVMKRE